MAGVRRIVYPDAEESVVALFTGDRLAQLEALGEFTVHCGHPADPADFLARMGEAHAVLLGWGLPVEALRGAKNLEIVSFIGMGVGSFVDLEEAARLGITVSNTPSAAESVAEHTMALMLAAARHVARYDREVRGGGWPGDPSFDLRGKTLGMIGFGRIAAAVVPLAKAFGMRIIVWTRRPSEARAAEHGITFADLDTVLGESDVLSLHLAFTPETDGLIDVEALRKTKPGVVLINTARAEVTDEAAMIALLRSGHIGAAGLDVFTQEPLPVGHPLTELDNVVLTPHSAYNTPEASLAMLDFAIDNVVAFYAGNPMNVVTRSAG